MIALTSKSENHSCATILSSASPLFSIEKPPEKPDHPIQKEKTTIRILPEGRFRAADCPKALSWESDGVFWVFVCC
jgi:hypothetical protein